ncbi:hypothetical protein ACFROC_22920 [Nocardia tengchongensis]|uniref:hypothetical protein n=1 Tax=Nocardia tengchongensis TaxID=2055889 RepID=UPI0036CC8B2B
MIGDPVAVRATISLSPMRHGDRVAEESIHAAEIHAHGPRLAVTVPEAHPHTTTIHSGGGSVVIQGNAVLANGSVVAGNVGHIGNLGPVTPTSGVWAEVRVPVGSAVYVVATAADVIVYGPVAAEIDTAGTVRTEPN